MVPFSTKHGTKNLVPLAPWPPHRYLSKLGGGGVAYKDRPPPPPGPRPYAVGCRHLLPPHLLHPPHALHAFPSFPSAREVVEEKAAGGVWDPKICVPKMARPDFPFCKFRFFPRWSLWSGGAGGGSRGGGGGPPPPAMWGHSNTSHALRPPYAFLAGSPHSHSFAVQLRRHCPRATSVPPSNVTCDSCKRDVTATAGPFELRLPFLGRGRGLRPSSSAAQTPEPQGPDRLGSAVVRSRSARAPSASPVPVSWRLAKGPWGTRGPWAAA